MTDTNIPEGTTPETEIATPVTEPETTPEAETTPAEPTTEAPTAQV